MARDLVHLRLSRREIGLLRAGLDKLVRDEEFTQKVQPMTSGPWVAAADRLGELRELAAVLDEAVE